MMNYLGVIWRKIGRTNDELRGSDWKKGKTTPEDEGNENWRSSIWKVWKNDGKRREEVDTDHSHRNHGGKKKVYDNV